jgi:hypothetical protein
MNLIDGGLRRLDNCGVENEIVFMLIDFIGGIALAVVLVKFINWFASLKDKPTK